MTAQARAELGRVMRFAAVGVTNTFVTFACYALLTRGGLAAPAASALGFAAGAANGYRLNRAWTFRAATGGAGTLLRYVAVQCLGAGLSAAAVAVATSDLELRRLAAEACVVPFVTVVTYILSRRVFCGPRVA